MTDFNTPQQPKPVLAPSKTSKYFIKKGVKKLKTNTNTYTKTDGAGNKLRFSKDHKFLGVEEERG